MKKRVIFLIIFLLSLFNVYAQSVRIGEEEISLVIIIPLIMIISVGIIFIVMIINDSRNRPIMTNIEIPQKSTIEKLNTAKQEETKKIIWINYLDVIDTFVRKIEERRVNESFNILIKIIRAFFKDRFNLDYEFTYDELLSEFKIKELRELNYKDEELNKKILYELADKLREIIKIIDRNKLREDNTEKLNKDLRLVLQTKKFAEKIQKRENRIDEKLNKFLINQKNRLLHHKNKTLETKRNFDQFDKSKLEQISRLIRNGRLALKNNEINKLKD